MTTYKISMQDNYWESRFLKSIEELEELEEIEEGEFD